MRIPILLMTAVGLSGCGFAQGFRDEGLRQVAGLAADEVDKRLGDDFKELGEGLREIPGHFPKKDPVSDTAGYGLGALLAYVLGSAGKGFLRARMGKNDKHI